MSTDDKEHLCPQTGATGFRLHHRRILKRTKKDEENVKVWNTCADEDR